MLSALFWFLFLILVCISLFSEELDSFWILLVNTGTAFLPSLHRLLFLQAGTEAAASASMTDCIPSGFCVLCWFKPIKKMNFKQMPFEKVTDEKERMAVHVRAFQGCLISPAFRSAHPVGPWPCCTLCSAKHVEPAVALCSEEELTCFLREGHVERGTGGHAVLERGSWEELGGMCIRERLTWDRSFQHPAAPWPFSCQLLTQGKHHWVAPFSEDFF